jgi:hypothetical protein
LREELTGTTDQAQWFNVHELSEVNVAEYAERAIQLALGK